jgi:hypothetical protein
MPTISTHKAFFSSLSTRLKKGWLGVKKIKLEKLFDFRRNYLKKNLFILKTALKECYRTE